MTKACDMSSATVSRIWRAFGLRPHRMETFKLSTYPLFIEKVRDIVARDVNPNVTSWLQTALAGKASAGRDTRCPAVGSMSLPCIRGPLADAILGVQLARYLCHLQRGRI